MQRPNISWFWCVHDVTNKPIAEEQISFRSCKHKTYTFTSNKITMRNPNENDKELQDDNRITTYPDRSNILFMNILTIKLYLIQLKN